METKVKKEKDGTLSLVRNGRNLVCPFLAPGFISNSIGQHQMVYQGCTSNCPHFHLRERTKEGNYCLDLDLTCGNNAYYEYIQYEEEKEVKIFQ